MIPLRLTLLILSLVLLALAAFGISTPKINFGWLGLAVYILAVLIT